MIKRILVGISGTPATPAKIRYSLELARHYGSSLSLMSVINTSRLSRVGPFPVGMGHMAAKMREDRIQICREHAEAALVQFEAAAAEAGVATEVIRKEGDPFDILTSAWRFHDLCILGVRGWFDHAVVPEPEAALHRLIGHGVRPLLAVTETYRPVRKVLVAFDGSMEASKAMKRFTQIGMFPSARLYVTCAGKPEEQSSQLLEEARRYLSFHGFEAQCAAIQGDTYSEILRYAQVIDADMVVLGSGLKATLVQRTFGTTAIAMVKAADRPLFLTH